MFPDSMRASDTDRQRVVDALQEQTGQGRLTLSEFEERSTRAYAATTLGDLRTLVTDLPVDVLPLATVNTAQVPPQWHTGYRQLPAARRHGALPLAVTLLAVLVVTTVVASVITGVFIFPFPLLIFGFILMRGFGGRGPGFHPR